MRLLKETTKARYSNTQLLNHLDRLSDFVSKYNENQTTPLRFDWACGKVYKFDFDAKCYYFECTDYNRACILDLIETYSFHVKNIKKWNMPKITKN